MRHGRRGCLVDHYTVAKTFEPECCVYGVRLALGDGPREQMP
jgi:hypothetical protein